jgi:hypothetical protein
MSETNESVIVVEPRRRGRPRSIDSPSSMLSVRIGAGHHDELVRMARDKRVDVSDLVRSILAKATRTG